jgi:hypothetical protein
MRLVNEKLVAVGLTALLFASVASAQSDAPADQQPAANQPPAANQQAPELSDQRDVQLTPDEMLKEADAHLARMDQGARNVRRLLSQARQERDVVKVLCLNDKLNQIDVALSSASDRQKSLQAMVSGNNPDQAKHEYTIIAVLRQRCEALLSEANQCVGEELGYVGDTQVIVDIDDDIPDTDPSEFPDDPFISEPPRLRSPSF